ncbi:MAG: hypothetical protein AB2556_23570, partial [Candidatus Thiodiazotropha sp.]
EGSESVELSRDTKPGVLTGIDKPYYENSYPVTAVVYGIYPIRDPDPTNLAPLKDRNLSCVAKRVMEHFQGALRGEGLTPERCRKIREWEERDRERGATNADVVQLERILKRAIILKDIAGASIHDSGKFQHIRWKTIELICYHGHGWPKDLHFPQSREVHIYEGYVWQGFREATLGEPIAVWFLSGLDGQQRQFSVDQFVLQDGCTFRTQEAHTRI